MRALSKSFLVSFVGNGSAQRMTLNLFVEVCRSKEKHDFNYMFIKINMIYNLQPNSTHAIGRAGLSNEMGEIPVTIRSVTSTSWAWTLQKQWIIILQNTFFQLTSSNFGVFFSY